MRKALHSFRVSVKLLQGSCKTHVKFIIVKADWPVASAARPSRSLYIVIINQVPRQGTLYPRRGINLPARPVRHPGRLGWHPGSVGWHPGRD